MNVSNFGAPRVGNLTWRFALLALGSVVILTCAISGAIYARGLPSAPLQHLIAPADWSIRDGVLEDGTIILRPTVNSIGLALHPIDFPTYTLQLRTQVLTSTLAVGVIYAAQAADHFSAFLINPDGYFALSDYSNGAWHVREPWRMWPPIRRADQPNRLRVECTAGGCVLYVNDESTWQITNRATAQALGIVAYPLTAAPPGAARFDQIDLQP